MRESSPPEAVSATGANGSPLFGRMRKTASSAPAAPGIALAKLDLELALPHADPLQVLGDRFREGARRLLTGLP